MCVEFQVSTAMSSTPMDLLPDRGCAVELWGSASDADVLGFEVFLDALEAAFPAEAAGLDAAEGRGGVGDDAGVQADHPGLQFLGDAESSVDSFGEGVGDQAVLGAVGQGYALSLIIERDDRGDRPERLLGQ